jgi:hypothetical protein
VLTPLSVAYWTFFIMTLPIGFAIDPAAFSSVPDLREHTRARIADALEHKAVVA